MPTALEIIPPAFRYGVGLVGNRAWAGSAGSPVHVLIASQGPVTSPYVVASSVRFVDVSIDVGSGVVTGSWIGDAASVTVDDMSAVIASGAHTGSWGGPTDVVAVQFMGTDERNTSVTSSDNPSPNQSSGLTDWNFFPVPSAPAPLISRTRDLTRYQKAYSFSRQMPVRVRLYRR